MTERFTICMDDALFEALEAKRKTQYTNKTNTRSKLIVELITSPKFLKRGDA